MRKKFRAWFLICLAMLPVSAIALRAQIALAEISTSAMSAESGFAG